MTSTSTSRKYAASATDSSNDPDTIQPASATSRTAVVDVTKSESALINGVLYGQAWNPGTLTYAFPDSPGDYPESYTDEHEPTTDFGAVSSRVKAVVRFALDTNNGNAADDGFSFEGFADWGVAEGADNDSTIVYAKSSVPDTAYAYLPSASSVGGDVWFGTGENFSDAVAGNYEFATVLHETGHALGLKHGQEAENGFPALPSSKDSLEYSIMTYRSYAGASVTGGYTNETFGYPQTYMMADIAALQYMYGANFSVNSGSTTYEWRPRNGNTYVDGVVAIHPGANRIFATIWDGGGDHDKYDLSAYSTGLKIDLRAGHYSVFKTSQLADLDAFSASSARVAHGNIYNALLYQGDERSFIEDATGGTGADRIYGNAAANRLIGGDGNDVLNGLSSDDRLVGGGGSDTFAFARGYDNDVIRDFGARDKINVSSFDFRSFAQLMRRADDDGDNVVFSFGQGDSLTLLHTQKDELNSGDFLL